MKIARLVLFLVGLLLIPIAAFGSNKIWTGRGGNAVWSNGANWDNGIAPRGGDDLVFGGQSTMNDVDGLSVSSVTVTSGTPVFSGNVLQVGALHVTGGTLSVMSAPLRPLSGDTAAGATLKLNGSTAGDISIPNGTLEVAAFSQASSLALGSSAQYIVDLNATFWDTNIDYLAVRGNVSLGGATLVLNPGTIFPGQTHTIIRNDGPNPVNGTFQGLPEGAWFIQSRMLFRITYHAGASGRDVAVVLPFNTGSWLFSSRTTSNWGSPLTLTAHVIAWGTSPTGVVEFFDGPTSLGTAVLNDWQDAKLTTYTLSAGAHNLTAVYQGSDFNSPRGLFSPSTSNMLAQTVQQAQAVTDTTLSGSSTSPYAGEKTAFTALVHAEGLHPTGDVTFVDGGKTLGTVPLDGTGRATLETTLPSGTHAVYATFSGSTNYQQSVSNTLTEAVKELLQTQTELSVSTNRAMVGVPVVLRATVLAAGGSPKGVVNFMDGSTMLGMAAVGFDQTASFTVALSPGEHTLIALYLGGDGFGVSTSATVTQQINDASVPTRRHASRP